MPGRKVVMLGPSLESPGGMTSVVRTLRDGGMFDRCGVVFISSYETRGLLCQLRVMARTLLTLLILLIRGRFGLLHVHSASRGSFWRKSLFCALAKTFNIPYIFQVHSGEFPVFFKHECNSIAKRWVRKTLRHAARVICLTESWKERLHEIETAAKISVIGNPVYVPAKLNLSYSPPREVLFLGRLREKKGVFDLVETVPRVMAACPQLHFILAGDEGVESVRAAAENIGVEASIEFPGWVDGDRKTEYLNRADIFVLPSYFECLPIGLLEAMAFGIPIVSTSVGGIPDLIVDNVHGLLVDPGDVEALAQALVKLGTDLELRERLRRAAFERVQSQYSLPNIVSSFEDLYKQFI